MRGDVAEPLDAGGLEGDVGVEAAGDGAVDDGLPLLLQQRDELLLGADVAADAVVDVVEVADDGALFGEGWEATASLKVSCGVQILDTCSLLNRSGIQPN